MYCKRHQLNEGVLKTFFILCEYKFKVDLKICNTWNGIKVTLFTDNYNWIGLINYKIHSVFIISLFALLNVTGNLIIYWYVYLNCCKTLGSVGANRRKLRAFFHCCYKFVVTTGKLLVLFINKSVKGFSVNFRASSPLLKESAVVQVRLCSFRSLFHNSSQHIICI